MRGSIFAASACLSPPEVIVRTETSGMKPDTRTGFRRNPAPVNILLLMVIGDSMAA